MKLELSKSQDRNKAVTYLDKLLEKKANIELREVKGQRSLRTNSYLHAILTLYAGNFGEHLHYVKEYVFKQECNLEIFQRVRVDEDTGEIQTWLRSTSDLDQNEMNTAIERFRNTSSQRGVYLASGDEYLREKFWIEKECEQYKQFI